MSKIKVNSIEAATGSTITIPSGQTLDISSTTLTLPSTVVTTTGTQTLTNKTLTSPSINTSLSYANQAEVRFLEASANGSNYVGFKAASSLSADKIWTLPTADGSANQAIITDGSGSLSFATVGATAGQVIQVVQATETTERSTTSTTFASLTFNASITPSSASNKVLVILSGTLTVVVSQGSAYINIYRGATALSSSSNGFTGAGIVGDYATNTEKVPLHISYLDSPNSTSSVTYTMYGMAQSGKTCKVNSGGAYQTSFILMEIKG